MQGNLRQRYPNALTFAVALGLALVVWVVGADRNPDRTLTSVYAAALLLFCMDGLETATLAPGTDRIGSPDRWTHGLLNGLYFMAFLTLLLWQGMQAAPDIVSVALLGGAIYGVLMVLLRFLPGLPVDPARYDLTRSMARSPVRLWIWRMWPLVALGLGLGLLFLPPTEGWDADYFLAQMILLPFLIPFAPGAKGQGLWRNPAVPRIAGSALLLAGLFTPL